MPTITHSRFEELADKVSMAACKAGSSRTLLLDLDGTLAPIADRPEEAAVPDATLSILERLIELGWRVVVVSGRPLEQVLGMVPVEGVQAFGSHGLEGELDGKSAGAVPDPALAARIERIAGAADELASGVKGSLVERKPAGVAFHYRLVPEELVPDFLRMLEDLLAAADTTGLEVIEGRRVMEIRPRGTGKGAVVKRIACAYDMKCEDASFVAAGDDRTDEDMFRAIRGLGLSIMVGNPARDTIADLRLDGCDSLRLFLARLAEEGSSPEY